MNARSWRRRRHEQLRSNCEGAMSKILPRAKQAPLTRADDPNPIWAFAVGLAYLFRTRPGWKLIRELESAVRRYAADPAALWRLMRDTEIIDAPEEKSLPRRG
jgi:hypothetical protein